MENHHLKAVKLASEKLCHEQAVQISKRLEEAADAMLAGNKEQVLDCLLKAIKHSGKLTARLVDIVQENYEFKNQ